VRSKRILRLRHSRVPAQQLQPDGPFFGRCLRQRTVDGLPHPEARLTGLLLAPLALGLQFRQTLGFFHRHQLLSRIADHRAALRRFSFEPTETVSAGFRDGGIRPTLKVRSHEAL
jgi:hypothetical protein